MAKKNEIEILITAHTAALRRDIANFRGELEKLKKKADRTSRSFKGLWASLRGGGTFMLKLITGFGAALAAVILVRKAILGVFHTIRDGVVAIDEMKGSIASIAGSIKTFSPDVPFEKAVKSARALVKATYDLDALYVGSAEELQKMVEILIQNRVQIDLTTESAKRDFVTLANTLRLVTQGQDAQKQIAQELRALAQGQVKAGNQLVRMLQDAGVNVKEMIPLWIEQGTLIQNLSKYLQGYAKATSLIEGQLNTQKATLGTIWREHLRKGLLPAYNDILRTIKYLNTALKDHNGEVSDLGIGVRGSLLVAWELVKGSVKGVMTFFKAGRRNWQEFAEDMADSAKNMGLLVTSLAELVEDVIIPIQLAMAGLALLSFEITSIWKNNDKEITKILEFLDRLEETAGSNKWVAFRDDFAKSMDVVIKKIKEGLKDALNPEGEAKTPKPLKVIARSTKEEIAKMKNQFRSFQTGIVGYARAGWDKQAELIKYTVRVGKEGFSDFTVKYTDLSTEREKAIAREGDSFNRFVSRLKNAINTLKAKKPTVDTAEQITDYEKLLVQLSAIHEAKLKDLEITHNKTFIAIKGLIEDMARTMESTMEGIFFNAIKGKVKDLKQVFIDFNDAMVHNFTRAIAKMISSAIKWEAVMKGIKGLFAAVAPAVGPGTAGFATGTGGYAPIGEGGILEAAFQPVRQFAEGGVIRSKTLGMIGEAGYPEAVIPLKTGKVPVELKGKGEGSQTLTIVNMINPDEIVAMGIAKQPGVILNVIGKNSGAVKKIIRG